MHALPPFFPRVPSPVIDSFTWAKLDASGEVPPPRWRHTATAVDGNKLVVFGGFNSSHVRLNDLYMLDIKSMAWSQQGNPTAAKERRRKKQAERGGAGAGAGAAEDKAAGKAAAGKSSDFLDDIDGCVGDWLPGPQLLACLLGVCTLLFE